jgi:hypothetical protein
MIRRALAAFAVLAAAPPAAPAQDQALATVDAVTPLSASGLGLLFSRRDDRGRYVLMYSAAGGPPAALPRVAPRAVPFDADLGTGPGGRPLAVYSRCTTDPPHEELATSPPDYTRGRGCRIVEYDIGRGREIEHRAGGQGEMLPAVWRDRIAFVRMVRGRPRLYLRPRRGGPARALPGGPTRDPFDHPTSLDLSGRRLAVAWSFVGSMLAPGSHIRLIDTVARTTRIVDHYRGGGLSSQSRIAPSFEGDALYWARACFGDPGGCEGRRVGLLRRGVRSGRTTRAPIDVDDRWQARGRGQTWILRDSSAFGVCRDPEDAARGGTCTILRAQPRYR